MSEYQNVELVNANNEPIVWKPAINNSRERLVLNVFKYFTESPEAALFTQELAEHAIGKGMIDETQLQINILEPEIQEFCLNYAAQKAIDAALDENLPEAYLLLLHYAQLPQKPLDEEPNYNLTFEDLDNIALTFSQAPELILAQEVCKIQSEMTNILNGNLQKNVTSFQANRIQGKFDDIAGELNFEQRAAGYYNISIIHRALLAEKDIYDPEENNAEKECLKKVLEYTSDYKRINYCVNRLQASLKDRSMVTAAYRRALTVTDVPQDLCKINTALAQCYLDDYEPKIGYRSSHSIHQEEDKKLERAEHYYRDAFSYAQPVEKITILKNIGKIQLLQNRVNEWTETETLLAMKFYQGEERTNALLEVASKNPRLRQEYLEQALTETKRSRKIKAPKKKLMLSKIAYRLQDIYQEKNQTEKLNDIKQYLQQPAQAEISNPLLKYTQRHR